MADFHIIVGLGQTGVACARHLKRQAIPFMMADTRDNPPGLATLRQELPDIAIELGELKAATLLKARCIILSPGLALRHPVIQQCMQHGIEVIGDIELFARQAHAPIAAITGTNAKSTVTTLVGEMAKAAGLNVAVGGNLGTPALELLNDDIELYVLEISSFQLETTYSLRAKVATILNISADHLDRYDNLQDYAAAKQRIYHHAKTAVYNLNDDLTYPPDQHNALSFGDAPAMFHIAKRDQQFFLAYQDHLIATNELPLPGKHNWLNYLAAWAMGTALGLPFAVMRDTMRRFPGLAHRCQLVGEYHGVKWYNDSKGTNVGAAEAAIVGIGQSHAGNIILIAGGMSKGVDFSVLKPVMKQYIKTLILIGVDAPKIAADLNGAVNMQQADSLAHAVALAAQSAVSGDIVLLSPACASFDMFKNFEHRGEVFCQTVKGFFNAK